MKKGMQSSDIKRIKRVIETDRLSFSESSIGLVETDIEMILVNYFELISKAVLSIKKDKGCYDININFKAGAIKPFTPLN